MGDFGVIQKTITLIEVCKPFGFPFLVEWDSCWISTAFFFKDHVFFPRFGAEKPGCKRGWLVEEGSTLSTALNALVDNAEESVTVTWIDKKLIVIEPYMRYIVHTYIYIQYIYIVLRSCICIHVCIIMWYIL